METKKFKKMAASFLNWLQDQEVLSIEDSVSEFWFATYGCNNKKIEKTLVDFLKSTYGYKE